MAGLDVAGFVRPDRPRCEIGPGGAGAGEAPAPPSAAASAWGMADATAMGAPVPRAAGPGGREGTAIASLRGPGRAARGGSAARVWGIIGASRIVSVVGDAPGP